MTTLERLGLAALRRLDPERAHRLAIHALRAWLVPLPGPVRTPRLTCQVAGLHLPNPVGLAAGFDKNAEAVGPLGRAGFGFLEVGAVTPKPQDGNPRPRLFRLSEDRAVINRMGFNNDGATKVAWRLSGRAAGVPIGLNLGANKTSPDRAADFADVLRRCGPLVDFATVNVSSPNTERLRDLQGRKALTSLLDGVLAARSERKLTLPIFVKIAPDLDDAALAEVAQVAQTVGLDGIVATNTTLARDGLINAHRAQAGGLSGRPLRARSTQVIARLRAETGGRLPLIGVGGIASAEDAYEKIRAGASAVQLYSALVFEGLTLVSRIAQGLDALLARDGFANVSEAVGADAR